MIKVRRVLYTSKGYLKGEYLGMYEGDIENVYEMFSQLWMKENTTKENVLGEHVTEEDVNYAEEFTFCGDDCFSIGVRNGIMYEGIAKGYQIYPGGAVDEYGFELMTDIDGNIVKYSKAAQKT